MKLRNISVLFLPLLILACAPRPLEELSREELFSLRIGKMDNQIDLFQIEGTIAHAKNRIYMRDGLFYIANGNSAKIMELSSYGDLIFLLYNPQENPPPVYFRSSGQPEEVAATRKAVAYPLARIGELAVDSEKRVYVEDQVSEERRVKDRELGVILDRVVLRFDRHGSLLDFIGQEGVGGTPFPYLDSLYVTDRDEPVVICRTPRFWHVFWYSPRGVQLFQVDIDQAHLPPHEAGERAVPSLGKIVPDRSKALLYLLVYTTIVGGEEAGQTYTTRIHRLNLESGRYEGFIEVPANGTRKEKIGTQEVEVTTPSFELLGVNSRGAFFLLRREEGNLFQLLVLDREGEEISRRSIVMEDSELYYKEIRLSHTGIIYALLGEEYEAKIVWWRSDRLMRDGEREGS